jgi:hypothetical protein
MILSNEKGKIFFTLSERHEQLEEQIINISRDIKEIKNEIVKFKNSKVHNFLIILINAKYKL